MIRKLSKAQIREVERARMKKKLSALRTESYTGKNWLVFEKPKPRHKNPAPDPKTLP